jgi:hypothetical protein
MGGPVAQKAFLNDPSCSSGVMKTKKTGSAQAKQFLSQERKIIMTIRSTGSAFAFVLMLLINPNN